MPEETAAGFLRSAQPRSCAHGGGETMGMSAKDERCASPTGNGDDAAAPAVPGRGGGLPLCAPHAPPTPALPPSPHVAALPSELPALRGCAALPWKPPAPAVSLRELSWGQGGISGGGEGVRGAPVLGRGETTKQTVKPSPGDGLCHGPQPLAWIWTLLFGLFVKTTLHSPSGAFGTPRRPGA